MYWMSLRGRGFWSGTIPAGHPLRKPASTQWGLLSLRVIVCSDCAVSPGVDTPPEKGFDSSQPALPHISLHARGLSGSENQRAGYKQGRGQGSLLPHRSKDSLRARVTGSALTWAPEEHRRLPPEPSRPVLPASSELMDTFLMCAQSPFYGDLETWHDLGLLTWLFYNLQFLLLETKMSAQKQRVTGVLVQMCDPST